MKEYQTGCKVPISPTKKLKTYWVEGGLGKHIMFSSLIPELAKKEKINIISAYPPTFLHNPLVENSWNIGQMEEDDEIKAQISEIKFYEPYKSKWALKTEKLHLMKQWAEGLGVDYKKVTKPDMYWGRDEENGAQDILQQLGDYIVIQISGGQPPVQFDPNNAQPYTDTVMRLQRNYPLNMAKNLIKNIKKKYPDLNIIDYSLPNEHETIEGTVRIATGYMTYLPIVKNAKAVIGIDSSLLHMAAAVETSGIGIWGGCPSWEFGWDIHTNLTNYNEKDEFDSKDLFYCAVDYNDILEELDKKLKKE